MELKKLSIFETVGCALFPCIASRYRTKALQKGDFAVAALVKGLQWHPVGFYTLCSLGAVSGVVCYRSEELLSRSISGCMTTAFAYLACVSGKRLCRQAGAVRDYYYHSRQLTERIAKSLFAVPAS